MYTVKYKYKYRYTYIYITRFCLNNYRFSSQPIRCKVRTSSRWKIAPDHRGESRNRVSHVDSRANPTADRSEDLSLNGAPGRLLVGAVNDVWLFFFGGKFGSFQT